MEKILTPLYRFLIYLEEVGSAELSGIDFIDKNSLRGVMGKMEAMGLVKKDENSISLSTKGYQFLNSILDAIHKPTDHWDGKWRIIYFSTPENIRSRRDKFRRDIETVGFKPIIKGLWFSPVYGRKVFDRIAEVNDMKSMSIFFEVHDLRELEAEKLSKAWNFDTHRKNFEGFVEAAQKFLSSGSRTRIMAKELIFAFAMISHNEPQLPIELLPKDWPKYRAKLMYKRLKNFISS